MSPQRNWIGTGICTLHLLDFTPLCVFKCLLNSRAPQDTLSHWLNLFDFFSTLCFQMCPHLVCQRVSMVTLIAFVWLLSTVRSFQMFLQVAYPRGSLITLVAFVCLFTNCGFWNTCSMSWPEKMQFPTGCICLIFHHSVFSNVSSNYMPLSFFKCLSKFLLKFSFWNACNCCICDSWLSLGITWR